MYKKYDSKLLNKLISSYKPDNAELLDILHLIQGEFGFISKEAIEAISSQLELSVAHVYGAATYYADFRFEPPPDTIIGWCSGPSCLLKNGIGIRDAMLAELDIELGEQRSNPSVEISMAQCNGTCEQSPQIWINDKVKGKLSVVEAINIARNIKDGK